MKRDESSEEERALPDGESGEGFMEVVAPEWGCQT